MDAVNTGVGAKAGRKSASTDTAGRSAPSKKATRRGQAPTKTSAAQDLQILQQAAFDLLAHGMIVRVYQHPGKSAALLVIEGAGYCGTCQQIRLAEEITGTVCQYCVGKGEAA